MKEKNEQKNPKKKWIIAIAVVLGLGFIGSLTDTGNEAEATKAPASTAPAVEEVAEQTEDTVEDVTEQVTEEVTEEVVETTEAPAQDNVTMGQKNALKQAKNYIDFMAFSYSGLVEQLEYEGYSHEDAVYGADNCGADWNEQAAKQAQNYLDTMAFSREGLIEQLEYEGFTNEQAVYGAEQVGY